MPHDSTTTHPFTDPPTRRMPVVLPGGVGFLGPNAIAACYALRIAGDSVQETVRELAMSVCTSEYLMRRGLDDLVQHGYVLREARYDDDGARLPNLYTVFMEARS